MTHPTDPFAWFAAWYDDAVETEPRVPDAMQIATVADGRPSIRTVLLKGAGPDGFVFYTNLQSRKAKELADNASIAATLHWKTRERQVHIEGTATLLTEAEADAYHASRPRGSQLGAWASRQSRVLPDRATLESRVEGVTAQFTGQPVPRPPLWGGYRITPVRIEFWQGRPDRLHDRVVFEREDADAAWASSLRYP
jgi:pyridoxamine 5'-phosphate oxidase